MLIKKDLSFQVIDFVFYQRFFKRLISGCHMVSINEKRGGILIIFAIIQAIELGSKKYKEGKQRFLQSKKENYGGTSVSLYRNIN